MASGSKPRWRDRLRSWKPNTNASQRLHKTGEVALTSVLGGLQLSLNQLPPLQQAIGGLLECITRLEIAEQNRQAYKEIMSDLTRLATLLQKHVGESNPQNMPYSMENVARAIHEQTENIRQQQDRSRISQLALATEDEESVLGCYRRVGALFQQLQADISLSIWDSIREQQMDTRLKDLLPAHDAYYNAALPTTVTKRVGCTTNTRVEILKAILNWARGAGVPSIYWMNGMAGTGKTTIAYTICKMLHEYRQLGASFFCSRNSPDCRNINNVVPTIAYQLGRYSNPYRKALCDVLNSDPDVAKRGITTQFKQLVSKPLLAMGEAMPDHVIVVIDGLDECTDLDGTRHVLNLLLRHSNGLPIKFFVTSRPEHAISNCMAAPGGAMLSILRLHDIEQSLVQADIKTYLTEALEPIEATPSEVEQLAARAGSLFIFAATAVRYIIPSMGSVDHSQRLQTVLKLQSDQPSKTYQDIDELYTIILINALDEQRLEQLELDTRQQALWTVVCASEPLTIAALAEILGTPNDRAVQLAIQPLQSVLHVSDSTNVVSTLHASFPDFLLNKKRAGRFHCDEVQQNAFLAERCFQVMERSLRFNICGLESSYQLDREVPELQHRIDKAISSGLFYSCIYWGDHLLRGLFSDPLLSLLSTFLQYRLLFWLEVLNLKGKLGHGDGVLNEALNWLPTGGLTADLRDMIHDARSFVVTLASNPTSLSTPHIYISALPFTPKQSHVRGAYWPKTQGLLSVDGATMEARGKPLLATWMVWGSVCGIAQSSNGKLLASGSADWKEDNGNFAGIHSGRIGIWDVSSGVCVLGPWKVCEPGVVITSVALSPDDTRLVSGSSDGAICLWDANKGDLIAAPPHHQTSSVRSVAFSPDGARLASGSDDQMIRSWDAYTGAPLGEPLKGHQGAVLSVAFSPDGKHLASGSSDRTIRVWDSRIGNIVLGPMRDHTGAVYSVAYSCDGLRLASGSEDCTVRVWDMSDGTLLAGPFEGHTNGVNCVSFSPNGTQIVSGSVDAKIRVWETVSGRLLAGPFRDHNGSVSSVLFSVDGTRILSGSDDGTIRVWDVRRGIAAAGRPLERRQSICCISLSPDGTRVTSSIGDEQVYVWDTRDGTLVAGPFKGHIGDVCSVAFSPDGACIVSGGRDCTWCIWDACTGALLVGPIEGHTLPGSIQSVVFSPDGSQIASGSGDCTVRLWDSHTGKLITKPFESNNESVRSVEFSPDGTRICICVVYASPLPHLGPSPGSDDGPVYHPDEFAAQMWLASDGTAPLWTSRGRIDAVLCVAFSPDGMRLVAGSDDYDVLVLDARDGTVLHGPFIGHTESLTSVAFSPDGKCIVSGSVDQAVCVWNVESGTLVAGPLRGHTRHLTSVAFSSDGRHVLSSSDDGTIRIWDMAAVARASASSSDDWSTDDDGWLIDSKSQRLFWVPPDLHSRFGFLTSSNPVVINSSCTTRIEGTTLLGDRWHECYVGSAESVPP